MSNTSKFVIFVERVYERIRPVDRAAASRNRDHHISVNKTPVTAADGVIVVFKYLTPATDTKDQPRLQDDSDG